LTAALAFTACGGSSRDAQTPADEADRANADQQSTGDETAMVDTNPDQDELAAPGSQGANAADAIAQARCAREARCDNIGADKKFSSTDACVQSIRDEWREDLSARECRSGVDDAELNECLSEVRSEDCSSPFETLERVAACTSAEICAD
jgi:hypothetical protein